MDAAPVTVPLACEPVAEWQTTHAPPRVELPELCDRLRAWLRDGNPELDQVEALLAWAARARGSIDLAIAEGLHALTRGDRLCRLCFHLVDYGREVLDVCETTTRALVRLGGGVQTRPLLREAVRSGKVGIRAAELVLPVATGDAEAEWVRRAATATVRELEGAVARAGAGEDPDEALLRLRAQLPSAEREVLDVALEVAGQVEPGSSRTRRLERMTQEFVGWYAKDAGEGDDAPLGPVFRPIDVRDASRRETAERETERWSLLPPVLPWAAPDVRFDPSDSAGEIDAKLRKLARMREGWDELIGWCAHAVRRSGLPRHHGFTSFRHYVEERLGVPARAVEQRERLERRILGSAALREARRQKVSYERLRELSKLPERDLASWIPRAKALTVLELRTRIGGERERQMRAAKTLSLALPKRVAVLLAAAIRLVRERADHPVSLGRCLAEVAWHFIQTWKHALKPPRSRSQQVRERDGGRCQAPGCSQPGGQSHHVEFRSRGGSDDPANQVWLCRFHHLGCIHRGFLTVVGTAPDDLTWYRNGVEWNGTPREEDGGR